MKQKILIADEGYPGLNPIQFGYEDCQKAHFYGPAVRTHWLIHFVVSGFGIFKIGDRRYTVRPGEMFIIPPFQETYYQADSENPWSYIWVGFTADQPLPMVLPDVVRCPEAVAVFDAMKDCASFTGGRSAFVSGKLWELFALLLGKEQQQDDYIKIAMDFIHTEYMIGITVEEIATRLNLDRTYFSALFKKKTGVSPKQYLTNYRMNVAASLLAEQGVSVSVVALSVGYSDIFTFSKMFKRHFGSSPKQYSKGKAADKLEFISTL